MSFKCAVVGYGNMGKGHAKILDNLSQLSAICEIDKTKEIPYAVPRYESFDQMLEKESLDAVHICTPHYLHAEMIIKALSKNINVFCEKPLCIRREDIDRILEAERGSKGYLGVCFQNRTNASTAAMREWLRGKKLYRAEGAVRWHRDEAYYASGAWRGKWATEGGGVLINQSIHTFDLMLTLCGYPREICAELKNVAHPYIEVEDTVTINCRGDIPETFFATTAAEKDEPVVVRAITDKGSAEIRGNDFYADGVKAELPAPGEWLGKPCYGSGHSPLIPEFYECIKTGTPFPIDGESAAKTMRAVLAAYESGGEWIKL